MSARTLPVLHVKIENDGATDELQVIVVSKYEMIVFICVDKILSESLSIRPILSRFRLNLRKKTLRHNQEYQFSELLPWMFSPICTLLNSVILHRTGQLDMGVYINHAQQNKQSDSSIIVLSSKYISM